MMAPTRSRPKSRPADLFPLDAVTAALGPVAPPNNEFETLIDGLGRRHESVLRFRREISPETFPLTTQPVAWYSLARRIVNDDTKASRFIQYAAGDYYLQDAGSLLALAACDADNQLLGDLPRTPAFDDPLLVCDLCAAPGGKASALLEAIGDTGFLLANEAIQSRIAPLVFNLSRTGSDRFAVTNLDPNQLAESFGGVFDLVLVDAPCTGQALVSKGKQSASALSPRQIQHSAARQERILDAALRLLRKDGRLIYSTCTFAEAENEAQIRRLVDAGRAQSIPVDRLQPYQSPIDPNGYRLWPHLHDCAGSFAASLRATCGAPAARRWKGHRSEKPPVDLGAWFQCDHERVRLRVNRSVMFAWPNDAPEWVEAFAVAGPEIAYRTGNTWKPSHAAALRRQSSFVSHRHLDVDQSVANQFLQGSPIPCSQAGWHVVRFHDRPLGWIKGSGQTGKNHLPAAARVVGPLIS